VGPVQFNVGGIHMDADDVVKRIKVQTLCGPKSSSSVARKGY